MKNPFVYLGAFNGLRAGGAEQEPFASAEFLALRQVLTHCPRLNIPECQLITTYDAAQLAASVEACARSLSLGAESKSHLQCQVRGLIESPYYGPQMLRLDRIGSDGYDYVLRTPLLEHTESFMVDNFILGLAQGPWMHAPRVADVRLAGSDYTKSWHKATSFGNTVAGLTVTVLDDLIIGPQDLYLDVRLPQDVHSVSYNIDLGETWSRIFYAINGAVKYPHQLPHPHWIRAIDRGAHT